MKVLDRLKLDLNHRKYFTDDEYTVFLNENNLDATVNYEKNNMQCDLVQSEIDIFDSLANDTDIMTKLDSEDFGSASECYKYVDDRINKLKIKLDELKAEQNRKYDDSPFTLMFTRN